MISSYQLIKVLALLLSSLIVDLENWSHIEFKYLELLKVNDSYEIVLENEKYLKE